MQFFADNLAPVILYFCAVAMFLLGIRRFRAGQPVKGVSRIAFAIVIAIMGWALPRIG
jgi:TM2 domain-containing membrane protein YozV